MLDDSCDLDLAYLLLFDEHPDLGPVAAYTHDVDNAPAARPGRG